MTKNIEGITFTKAITLGPLCEDGRVEFIVEGWIKKEKSAGVYAVFKDEEVIYIGSYKRGIISRWLYPKKRDLYHFKKPLVVERLQKGETIHVYAQSESSVKEEINCTNNIWVNVAGIEARLIERCNPPWNKLGRSKTNVDTPLTLEPSLP